MKNNSIASITTRKEGFHIDIGEYTLSIGCGSGHYSDNHMRPYNADNNPTATMEVALMKGSSFLVLEYDVAAYVSVAHLPKIILAVEREDWQMFCDLCDANMKGSMNYMHSPRLEPEDGNALVGLFWATLISLPFYALIFWAVWG